MPNLLECPHCGQEITIPDGIDPSEPLCCPICDAEFLLSEVVSDETTAPLEPVSDEIPLADAAEQEAAETEAVGSEIELEPAEAESDAAAFASWALAAEGESTEAAPEAPEAEAEPLDLAPEVPEAEAEPLDVVPEAPEAVDEMLDLVPEAPEVETEPLDLAPEAPEAAAEPFDFASEAPEAEAEPLEFVPEAPKVETEPLELAPEAPQAEAETFELAAEAPDVAAEPETYELAGEAPQGEAEIPEPQPEIPEAEAEAVGATVRTVKAKAEDLKARVETLLADVAALEAEMGEAAGERPQLDVWKQVGAAPPIDTREEGTAAAEMGAGARPAHAGAFDFGADEAAEGGAPTAVGARPRQKKKRGAFFTLLEWVFGGVVGLLIAYYAINWIRGEQGNFLEIPLPGVPHTYKHCPDWWPGWLKPWADAEESDPQQVAASETPGGSASTEPAQQASVATRPASSTPATPAKPPPRKTFPPDYVGLANPPSFTPSDLGTALKAAHASFGCPKCNSTGQVMQDGNEAVCPDCQGNPPEGLMPSAYGKFCHLAEVVTFLDDAADDPQTGPRKSAIADLLKKLGRDLATVDKVGFEAGKLCSPENRDGNGVLLAGIVQRAGTVGHANATHVQMAVSRRTVIVVTKDPLPVQPRENVFILGSFVDDPAENLIGFETSQPLVVWGGMAVKREE